MSEIDLREFGIRLSRIEPGQILLGQKGRLNQGNGPLYAESLITLTRPFYISRDLVTQANWDLVFGGTFSRRPGTPELYEALGSALRPQIEFAGDNPAIFVDWTEANDFCVMLSRATGKKITLPTDAQWEYCYRAGTSGEFFWGDSLDPEVTRKYAWHSFPRGDKELSKLRKVGQLLPNPWGIYDMAGLVIEWVRDSVDMISPDESLSPIFPPEGQDYWGTMGDRAILRNASYNFMCQQMSACSKSVAFKDKKSCFVGFRIVVEGV